MAQAVDILNDLVREELPRMFIDLEPEVAPVFEKVKRTSFGVKSQDGLGKGYQVVHMYETGSSGLFESADPLGPAMSSISGNMAQMLALGSSESNVTIFPDAKQVPHTGEVKRTLTLHKVTGNYSIPVEWKQLDMLNAMQLKKVARDLKAVAKSKLQFAATSFFSHEVTNSSGYINQVLGRISTIAQHSTLTNYVVITLDEQYGRIANFMRGQALDIVADSSGTLQNGTATDGTDVRNYTDTTQHYVRLIVSDVDYLGKTITLCPIDTTTGTTPTYGTGTSGYLFEVQALTGDWLVYAHTTRYTGGSRPQHSWGINNWIKASGTILGGAASASGLDLDIYSMYKSKVASVGASLTDDIVNSKIAGYLDSYAGESLDTIILTRGVQQQWLKQPNNYNNRQVYDRTGKAMNYAGGWSKMTYEFGGRTFEFIVSPMCLAKTMYVTKFSGNNLLRYGPPRIGGTDASMGPELEFLAPLSGHTGVFMGVNDSTNGSRPTDLLQAPFWYYELLAPADPRGMKLTDITEATLT